MYLIPNSRSISAIRSEPYSALLLRPMPAAQTSGVPGFVCSATVFSSVIFFPSFFFFHKPLMLDPKKNKTGATTKFFPPHRGGKKKGGFFPPQSPQISQKNPPPPPLHRRPADSRDVSWLPRHQTHN